MKSLIFAKVQRGGSAGVTLYPHKFRDGNYVVSKSRFQSDYIRLANIGEVKQYIERGYSLRMSNPSSAKHRAPSLISPSSIELPS